MAIKGVLRPGFAQIRVLDMKEAIIHYRDRIGLTVVSTEADGRVYLKAYDEFDRHSLILRECDEAGIDYMSFKVDNEESLNHYEEQLRKADFDVTPVEAGEQPGVGGRIHFTAPTGHRFDLYVQMELSNNGPMTNNPDVSQLDPTGMKAIRFDHCLLYGGDLDGTQNLFVDILGFSVSEQVVDDDTGMVIATFLTCSNKAHDLALVRHEEDGKLHHVSFLVEDWTAIRDAADIMTRYDISRDIGPTRHGITRGQTIYFFDPSGNRNEVFAGGYHFYPDNPVRIWQASSVGKAIFYYERELNDRFMTVVT